MRVVLTIARRFANRIRRNSEAKIVTQGLLGDKLVEITLGSPDRRRWRRATASRPRSRSRWRG